jgi:hypothetical protein
MIKEKVNKHWIQNNITIYFIVTISAAEGSKCPKPAGQNSTLPCNLVHLLVSVCEFYYLIFKESETY